MQCGYQNGSTTMDRLFQNKNHIVHDLKTKKRVAKHLKKRTFTKYQRQTVNKVTEFDELSKFSVEPFYLYGRIYAHSEF